MPNDPEYEFYTNTVYDPRYKQSAAKGLQDDNANLFLRKNPVFGIINTVKFGESISHYLIN